MEESKRGHLPQYFKANELTALEAAVHDEGYDDFHVWPQQPARADYSSIIYIEPFDERNRRAFGFDMMSEPIRRAAMLQARDSAAATISGKVVLKQEKETSTQPGFLMYLPIFDNTLPSETLEQRRTALRGYVYMPIRMNNFMSSLFGNASSTIGFRIFDDIRNEDTAPNDASLFYASDNLASQNAIAYSHPLHKSMHIAIAQHLWTLQVVSLPAFEASVDRQKSILLLLSGSLISFLLFFIARDQATRHEETIVLAARMTTAFTDSEIRFSTLINAADEFAIIATDANGNIKMFSTGAEKMLGYHAKEMTGGKHLSTLYDHKELHRTHSLHDINALVGAAKLGRTETREWIYQHRNGENIPVQITISAIRNAAGNILGYISVAKDVRHEREAAIALHNAKERAEAASKAKSTFVANMSHEIRTPLNAVLGITELMTQTALSANQKKYVEMIRSAGQSLLHVLNDILDFSKMEAERMELSVRPFVVSELLDAIATLMSASARDKDLELAIGIDAGVPNHLIGDSLRLQQILINLVSNAIKFTAHGEVALLVKLIAKTDSHATLSFRVHDTGIGMKPDQLARIFTPFSQVDESPTRLFSGTGLGLSISEGLIRLMGGKISVSSTFGEGSAFEISVPLQLDLAQADTHLNNALPKLRLLIVDDNATSRDYLALTAHAIGWHADSEASAQSALERLKNATHYDAVMVDWKMPGMDGLQFIHSARALDIHKMPFVLMVNAFAHAELLREASSETADAVIIKPIANMHLTYTLRDALARKYTAPANTGNAKAAPAQLDGMHLLVVEDNRLNQVVARGLLENAGATIDIAENGQRAVDMLRSASTPYQLVLMDAQMPVMDGVTATRIIRNELGLSLPIIAMTAAVMETEREIYFSAGMNDVIAKPIDSQQLFATIRRYTEMPDKLNADLSASDIISTQQDAFDHDRRFNDVIATLPMNTAIMNIIKKMADHDNDPIRDAEQLWRAGKHDEAARLFHTLRGSLGMFGSPRFLQIAQQLESAIKRGDAVIDEPLREIQRELHSIRNAAQHWLAAQDQKTNANTAIVSSDAFERLLALLTQQNLAACQLYQQLRADLSPHMTDDALDEVDNAVNNLAFERALAILRTLKIA